MSEKVDLKQLEAHSQELMDLINNANRFLDGGCKVSDLGGSVLDIVDSSVSNISTPVKYAMAKMMAKGHTPHILAACAAVGVVYLGAKGIDGVRNAMAKKRVNKERHGYYNELISKNGMLIEAQQGIIEELRNAKGKTEDEVERLNAKLDILTHTINRMSELKKTVTK